MKYEPPAHLLVHANDYTIEKLRKGFKYQIPIKAEELVDPPIVSMEVGLQDTIEVHAGAAIKLRAKAYGRPKPKIAWQFEQEYIEDAEGIVFGEDVERKESTIQINSVNRYNSGKYTIVAK